MKHVSEEELAQAWRSTAKKWWKVVKRLEQVEKLGASPCEMCDYASKHTPKYLGVCAACPARDLCDSVDGPYGQWRRTIEEAMHIATCIAEDCDWEAEKATKRRLEND